MAPSRTVIIEDTTLLILHELQLLELFLDQISEFFLLNSTFERIAKNSHPVAGTIYTTLAKDILDNINKYKSKMVLLPNGENTPVDSYIDAINKYDALFIVDDLNILQLINVKNKEQVTSANIFNIIEMLSGQGRQSKKHKFSLIAKASSLGLRIPNMTISLLAETLAFHSRTINETDYLETEFKVIFDKIFSAQRDTVVTVELFLKMLGFAINHCGMALQPLPILALFRSFLLRHCYKDLESFVAFSFVYLVLTSPIEIESTLLSTSKKHVDLWKLYQDIQLSAIGSDTSTKEILVHVVQQIFTLQEKPRILAYNNIKHCFIPMTEESEVFERVYQETSLHHRLFN